MIISNIGQIALDVLYSYRKEIDMRAFLPCGRGCQSVLQGNLVLNCC